MKCGRKRCVKMAALNLSVLPKIGRAESNDRALLFFFGKGVDKDRIVCYNYVHYGK